MNRIEHQFDHSYHAMIRMEQRHISSKKIDACIWQGKISSGFGKNRHLIRHRNIVAVVNLQDGVIITAWKDSLYNGRRQKLSFRSSLDKTSSSRCTRRQFRQKLNQSFDDQSSF